MNFKGFLAALAATAVATSLVLAQPAHASRCAAIANDFNGDGYPELVAGASDLRVGSVEGAGGVVVSQALRRWGADRSRIITQGSPGLAGVPEQGNLFGFAVASADFDRDGFADLAVGRPGESAGSAIAEGAVSIIYGSSKGLDTRRSQSFRRKGAVGLGTSLIAADFSGDGYPDLAVGSPGEDQGASDRSGAVHVLRGGSRGIDVASDLVLHAGRGADELDLRFGEQLAAGLLDDDHVPDLVVGSPGDPYADQVIPGSIRVCFSSHKSSAECTSLARSDRFAGMTALAVGRVTGTERPDVVVGVGYYNEVSVGRVSVLQLAPEPPFKVVKRTEITRASAGVQSRPESDGFGTSIATADVDRDGYSDMVIGAPFANEGRGQVSLVHGGPNESDPVRTYSYSQDSKHVPGRSESGDLFGGAVSLLDFNQDGRLDLTVGAPGEDDNSGAVVTLRGFGKGFTALGSRTVTLSTLHYQFPEGAFFGATL